jgi:hypothetical protein
MPYLLAGRAFPAKSLAPDSQAVIFGAFQSRPMRFGDPKPRLSKLTYLFQGVTLKSLLKMDLSARPRYHLGDSFGEDSI